MDVTKENFSSVLPEVLQEIRECCLIALDTEFTGLNDGLIEDLADLPEDRYRKLRKSCSRFALISVGVCLFKRDTESPLKFSARPYNFFVFPSSASSRGKRFLCQVSSLQLLANHGMDFNKWIKNGIGYMTDSEETEWLKSHETPPTQEKLDTVVGFSQVLRAISESGKPVVAHNCVLDLLHLHTHFIAPLPEKLSEFKANITKRLPHLYDTKVIARDKALREHMEFVDSLPDTYSRVTHITFPKKLTIDLPPACSHFPSGALHQAAYDAYITGYSLLAMKALLESTSANADSTDSPNAMETMAAYHCKAFLSHCEGTHHINMEGEDAHLTRDHVFYMTFPKEMTLDDLKNFFSLHGKVWVSWINSTSAHIIIKSKSKAQEAFRYASSMGAIAGKAFTIAPFKSESESGEGGVANGEGSDVPRPLKRPLKEDIGEPVVKKPALFEEMEWPTDTLA